MTTSPNANGVDATQEPDSLDYLLASLGQYDSLFGEKLRAAALSAAWKELAETDPRVITHMSLRLSFLQAKAATECLSDLSTGNELLVKLLESQLRSEKLLRRLVSLADEGVGELDGLRQIWDDSEPESDEPELDGGNVSVEASVDAGEPS